MEVMAEALTEQIFPWHLEPERMEAHAEGVLSSMLTHGSESVCFTHFVNLREELRERVAQAAPKQYQPHMRATFHLMREYARMQELIKIVNNIGIFGEDEVTFLFHLLAWCHIVLVSQYHSGTEFLSVDTLDHISAAFAVLPWAEVAFHMKQRGVRGYLFYHRGTAESMFVYGTITCLCVALVGALVIEVQYFDLVPLGTARFFMTFAALTIFTQNVRFSQMLQTIGTVSAAAGPIVTSLCAITCLYARAAVDLFGDKALNAEADKYYFSTYGRSLSTFFRIFTGEVS